MPNGQTGTLTIPAGANSVSLPWSAVEDGTVESLTETATLTASKNILSGNVTINAGVGNTTQVFTVYDNDLASVDAHIATNLMTVSESVGQVQINLMLNKASATPVDFAYNLTGTAIAGNDYTLSPGVVRFQPGEILKIISIPIINDNLPELTNTIQFNTFLVTGASTSGPSNIIITVLDDDGAVVVNLANPTLSVNEAVGTLQVPFTLDRAAGDNLTLNFTISGTTDKNHDYVNSTSYLIPAGTINGNIPIQILDDGRDEPDETLIVTLQPN